MEGELSEEDSSTISAIPAATISLGKSPSIMYYWHGYCDVPQRGVSNNFTQVFSNHLLLDNLLIFTDVKSMKMLASTCHRLYESVRKNRSFQKRTKLTLTDVIFEYISKPFKNDHPQASLQSVLPSRSYIIETCKEWTSVNHPHIDLSLLTQYLKKNPTADVNLKNFPCEGMKLLFLAENGFAVKDIVFIGDSLIPNSVNEVVQLLQNLKCLESLSLKNLNSCYPNTMISRILLHNLKSLKSLSIDPLEGEPDEFIRELLAPTLRSFEFSTDLRISALSKDFDTLPDLEHLTIRTIGCNVLYVTRLIKSLPTLQSLSLVLAENTSEDKVLREALSMRTHPRLTKLRVAWKVPISYNPGSIGWSFLRNWNQLQDIEIHEVTYEGREDVLDVDAQDGVPDKKCSFLSILCSIPDTVKRLVISGVADKCIGASVHMDIKVELNRFTNTLSVLDIFRCKNVMTNEILGFICTHFGQLQEFGFSHCGVTDVGLIGCEDVDGNIIPGLSALNSLRKLRIATCNSVSLNGYRESISFPHLNHLTLFIEDFVRDTSEIEHIPIEFYLQLIAQNKWLQSFTTQDNLLFSKRTDEYISFGWEITDTCKYYHTNKPICKITKWNTSLSEKLPITFSEFCIHLTLPSVEDTDDQEYFSYDDGDSVSFIYNENDGDLDSDDFGAYDSDDFY